jgi:polyisoprenyl-phosphate glycosyltransferase
MTKSKNTIEISVVAPCYNEEKCLPEFVKRTDAVLRQLKMKYEIILVNDGSRDRSLEIAVELTKEYPHLKVANLSRNFGHQVAVTAGMDLAVGEVVVLIDADLQDPPELISELAAKWREGADVVYGQRKRREGETAFKLLTSKLFYRLLKKITRVNIPMDTGDFRLMNRKVVDAMKRLRESHRFIRGLVTWTGFTQAAVLYDRKPRFAGETHYPLRKMLLFSMDAITSFSILPLRMLTVLGSTILFLSILFSIVVLIVKLLDPGYFLAGFPTLVLLITFFGGIQLISLGIIGEYVGRVYEEIKRRPLYFMDGIYQRGSLQEY